MSSRSKSVNSLRGSLPWDASGHATVAAVVNPRAVHTGSLFGLRDWRLWMVSPAWRAQGGRVRPKSLVFEYIGPKSAVTALRQGVRRSKVVQLVATRKASRREQEGISVVKIELAARDPELLALARQVSNPPPIQHAALGTVRFERKWGWYRTSVIARGVTVDLVAEASFATDGARRLELAANVVRQAVWRRRVSSWLKGRAQRDHVMWLKGVYADGTPIDTRAAAKSVERLRITEVLVSEDESVRISFEPSLTFGGYQLVIHATTGGKLLETRIP